MQALIEAFIWVGLLGLFLLFVVYVPWVQKIWIKNGKWHAWRFMLVITSLLVIKDILLRIFSEQITAWLVGQEIGFGVLYHLRGVFGDIGCKTDGGCL